MINAANSMPQIASIQSPGPAGPLRLTSQIIRLCSLRQSRYSNSFSGHCFIRLWPNNYSIDRKGLVLIAKRNYFALLVIPTMACGFRNGEVPPVHRALSKQIFRLMPSVCPGSHDLFYVTIRAKFNTPITFSLLLLLCLQL